MHKNLTKPPSKILSIILKALISFSFFQCCKAIVHIPNFDLSSTLLDPPTTGFSMKVDGSTNYLGFSVNSAGDVNGDGYKDIIVGAYARDSLKGAAYVIYGHPNFPSSFADLDLTALDPAKTGFSINGNSAPDYLGYSVSAGKINEDEYDDIIIGAPTKSSNKGMVYVIYGGTFSWERVNLATNTLDPLTTGFSISGNAGSDHFGLSVSTAGDVNGDGFDDVIIGAPTKNSNTGTVYVVYGGPSSQMASLDLAITALNPASTGFYIAGQSATDWFGFSVATAGNLDNDEYDDIIIGVPNKNSLRGFAYVIFGRDKASFANINLATDSFSATNRGFFIIGSDPVGQFGRVNPAGDIDGDGYDDIIVGSGKALSEKGAAYVIYGSETMGNLDLSSTTLDPATTGFTITGEIAPDRFGISVGSAEDVNGDGYQDMIIGAYQQKNARGAAYVVYGGPKGTRSDMNLGVKGLDPATTGFKVTGNADGDLFGFAVNGAGDVNGDGFDDIVIGAHAKNTNQGAAYLIHSSCVTTGSGQCQERNFCESCDKGYDLTNSKCQECPANCQKYIGLTTCEVCEKGYFLLNSLCIKRVTGSESLSKASQALSDTVSSLGGALSIGSSLFPVTKLVSKIVQNTRYLDLIVTFELTEVYQNWNTNLINVDLPDAFSSLGQSKSLPETFARYDLNSAFLANFWSNLVILGGIFCTFIASRTLKKLLDQKKFRGWGHSLLERIVAGSLNLTLVQGYGCLDDVIFYFALDVQTSHFKGGFSWVSFFIGLAFLGLGFWLILFNVLVVKRYQRAKSDKITLENFHKNNKHWELFYGDFNDVDSWAHSFLAILAIRNCISSFIITVLYSSPLMQTSLLVVIDGTLIIFLTAKKPLPEPRARWTQYFYEITALLVHICTFILAMQGDRVSPLKIGKILFCKVIIYLNYGLIIGGVALMFLEIYKTISPKIKTWRLKQKQKAQEKTVKKIVSDDSLNQSEISAVKPLDSSIATLCQPAEKSHRQKKVNIKRMRAPQDHMESGLNFEQQSSLNPRGKIFSKS